MKRIYLLFLFLLTATTLLTAQTRTITGTVKGSEDSQPVPGCTVQIKGTTAGTLTDINGKYSLSVPQNATTLVFSYIGMKTLEVEIGGRSVIDVSLQSDVVGLSEVVVTALGIKRSEKSIGYSASTVNSNEINTARAPSLITGLQGKVAGLSVTSGGGTGGTQKVYIRGVSSFTGSN